MKIVRKPVAAERLGGSVSTLEEKCVQTGRLKKIYLGKRSVGFLEADVDRLVQELIAESENHPERRALAPQRQRRTAVRR
jgi:predicted DNA-binding transcriptional regulator AlpA